MPSKPILIVQGAQFGSEAKGAVAHFLCQKESVRWAVRTGSINAGHSIMVGDRKLSFQQLPTGAVLPGVNVVLGPGAYVHPETVVKEMELAGCFDRTFIDEKCGVHLCEYAQESAKTGRTLRIGATGKGCAEAIIHKIRDRGCGTPLLLREWVNPDNPLASRLRFDTAELLNDAHDRGERILIEGTQGTHLDLHCGPYPFTTSRQTIASAWVTEAGLSPALDYEVVLVVRTYPIRVAGNSGPMGKEITWQTLARRINARLCDSRLEPLVSESALVEFERAVKSMDENWPWESDEERLLWSQTRALGTLSDRYRTELMKLFEATTVTKRLRRIAELDVDQLRLTVKKERPAYVVLTFLNYHFAELVHTRELHAESRRWLANLQNQIGAQIRYVNIGPRVEDFIEVDL